MILAKPIGKIETLPFLFLCKNFVLLFKSKIKFSPVSIYFLK